MKKQLLLLSLLFPFCLSAVTITWNGSFNDDWTMDANWDGGFAPAPGDDVVIPSSPTNDPLIYNTTVTVNSLSVNNVYVNIGGGGSLTITTTLTLNGGTIHMTNGSLTVNGNVTNNGGAVDVCYDCNFVQGSSSTYSGTGYLYVFQNGQTGPDYNLWSTPVANGTLPGTSGYEYDPASGTHSFNDDGGTNSGTNDPGWVSHAGTMTTAKGYASKQGSNATFVGTPNNGNIPIGVTSSGQPMNSTSAPSKFNLIGNPYPSAISYSAFYAANSSRIAAPIYFWSDDLSGGTNYNSSDYAVRNGSGGTAGGGGVTPNGNIGTAQGFFVECTSSGNVNFTNAMRITTNDQFFKTEQDEPYMNRIWLSLNNDTLYNEILVAFKDDATEQRDLEYDAYKLRGNPYIALSAKQEGDDFVIVAFPSLTESRIVPLGVYMSDAGTYELKNKNAENFENITVFLEDRLLGTFTDLSNNGTYSAYMSAENCVNRFFLHFADAATGIEQYSSPKPFVSYTNGSELVVLVTPDILKEETLSLTLTDMAGKIIVQQNVQTQGSMIKTDISGLAAGLYVISLQTATNVYSGKTVIK